jgi:serpin B
MDLSDGNNKFVIDIYQSLVNEDTGNIFNSPFSISLALAMAYAGAQGDTREQIGQGLHFDLPSKELHLAFKAVRRSLEESGKDEIYGDGTAFKLNLANSIWGHKGFAYKSDYTNLLSEYYGAGLRLLDFIGNTEKSRGEINQWVSHETGGKIQDLIPAGGINNLTRLILANAIYFYASWAIPLPEHATHDGDFTLLDGEVVEAPLMESIEYHWYTKGWGYQAVSLPYIGDRYSMYVILPDLKRFKDFESKLDVKFIDRVVSKVKRVKVELTLPKFKFDSNFSLKGTLVSLGIKDAFTESADFSGMVSDQELFIDDVYHKAYLAVDEKGTEAAAATGIGMAVTAFGMSVREKVYRFNADHPFIFLIYDAQTGSILFMGRVLDPR